ncbi:MAG TPA: prepilin-type N-terminal cleavage/methylation domain-containing protein [Kofleriaceae bacterium]|nr:prepilin-type N-terminal cleavage/methylation domain-containing protein [Kofleriaceae bacterium]
MTNTSDTGQRGFTVIEVLITLAVTLIGLAGLMTLHHVISEGTASAGRLAEASSVAEAALEDVRREPFTRLETQFGTAPIDVELEQAAGRGERVYERRLFIVPLDAVSPDLFRVRIEVSWSEDGATAGAEGGLHDHTLVLESFRTRQEAL